MAEFDLVKSALEAGMAFTEMTRQRAEAIVRDLAHTSEVNREQAAKQVEALIERSRRNTELLLANVKREVDNRLGSLATNDDLNRLAARLGVDLSATRSRSGTRPRNSAASTRARRPATVGPSGARKASGATKKAGRTAKSTGARKPAAAKKAAKKA